MSFHFDSNKVLRVESYIAQQIGGDAKLHFEKSLRTDWVERLWRVAWDMDLFGGFMRMVDDDG